MVWVESGSRLPRGMTPAIIRGSRAGGGGNFNNSPIVLRDQTLNYNGTAFDAGFRFLTNGILQQNGGGDLITVASLPTQWHENQPAPPGGPWSVRHTALFDSDVSSFVFDFPALDAWRTISTTRAFDMSRPAVATTEGFTLTIQMALTADLGTILAQRDIRFVWARP